MHLFHSLENALFAFNPATTIANIILERALQMTESQDRAMSMDNIKYTGTALAGGCTKPLNYELCAH